MQVFAENDRAQTLGELFSMSQNHLEGLLKYRSQGPRLRVPDSAGLGTAYKSAFLTWVPGAAGSGSIL